MKFLIDNALSPSVSQELIKLGYDSLHVQDVNLNKADDIDIFKYAEKEDRIIISADTDFGTILSLRQYKKPSVILFRRKTDMTPDKIVSLLKANLPDLEKSLINGCIVIIGQNRIRIRDLPIGD